MIPVIAFLFTFLSLFLAAVLVLRSTASRQASDMPLTTAQKQAVTSFTELTGVDKRIFLLAEPDMPPRKRARVSQASDPPATATSTKRKRRATLTPPSNNDSDASYFASGAQPPAPSPHAAALNKLFDSYRDDPTSAPDEIHIDGAQKYMADLGVSLESPGLLVLSTLVRSPSLGNIPREGFVEAWAHLGAPTIKQQAQVLGDMSKKAGSIKASQALAPSQSSGSGSADDSLFRRVYKHTFTLALPTNTPNARAVPLDEASEYWRVLLGPGSPGLHWVGKKHGTPLLDWWLGFLEETWKKAVNRDLWNQTLLYAEKSTDDESLGFWSEESAWPGVIDEFTEHAKERRQGEGMDTD